MPSSYTSLLGLLLPVQGELTGTWGDTVNNELTALLDTAVAGTTTLSTDADVTLTDTTGTANQARQIILNCTGARTVLRTITAPARSKAYIVINNTTGGFGVKIVGVGPTTGVTIAAGDKALVAWNGSDFVRIGASAGGSDTQVQYNNSGNLAGSANLTFDGSNLQIGAQGDLRFADSDSTNWVAFQSPATVVTNVTWTLPDADGTSGQVLQTNGSGTLSWSTPSSGVSKGQSIAFALIFGL
jgi:hypothetical protein